MTKIKSLKTNVLLTMTYLEIGEYKGVLSWYCGVEFENSFSSLSPAIDNFPFWIENEEVNDGVDSILST